MTNNLDIVKLYNPANADALTTEQLESMQKLTSEEIKTLAKAYPNMTMQRAYLLIIDGSIPAHKQLPTLSSFENLYNLREKNGQRKYVAFQFKANYKPRTVNTVKPRKTEVLDLSETELMNLPGFKTADNGTMEGNFAAVTVPVTKVKKEAVKPAIKSAAQTISNPKLKTLP